MKILGIRTSLNSVRYAILEFDGTSTKLINSSTESKLNFPALTVKIEDKISWLNGELNRIINENSDIELVAIKTNEYSGADKKTARTSVYLDGGIISILKQNDLPVTLILNSQIEKGMNSKKIKAFAESHVDKTTKYWDEAMASAIAAAWSVKTLCQ